MNSSDDTVIIIELSIAPAKSDCSNKSLNLYAHFSNSDDIDAFLRACTAEKVTVGDMHPLMQKDEDKGGIVVLIEMRNVAETDHEKLVRKFFAWRATHGRAVI